MIFSPSFSLQGRLDLSWNRLGASLKDLFTTEWTSTNLYELTLTGCDVTRGVLDSIAECPNLPHLTKLRLDQNNLSGGRKKAALIRCVGRMESTLKYLDVSSCALTKGDVVDVCSVLLNFNHLQHLVVYPNGEVTVEVVRDELLPMLKGLPCLRCFPPLDSLECEP